ncbi:HD domain-containing protein [Flavobacterium amniphilum]|uniref:HD domain-containing protein n=1 Tax=Flavobacterium amniphilum TaxID=1834035 RepID=UPI00202A6BE0|nr:HD domain-containing protein [Flavobacterium amniphilum]MCL9806890.1 HD domain-containing protein [Flavobacterium amniphilum]
MKTQSIYQDTLKFAAGKHAENNQTIPGTNLPYVVHLSNVAMEILIASQETEQFGIEFAIQVALLHDTLEDTNTTFEELTETFSLEVANAVSALTKRNDIPKAEKMKDSLKRIKELSKEVGAVKLADRITNLQSPPSHWSFEKRLEYQKEAIQILEELKGANTYLENRLKAKIDEYSRYCVPEV